MSKEIFEKNLTAMEKWYPTFAEMIREKTDIEDDTKVLVETSWDGEKLFRIQKDGRTLYLGGKRNAKEPIAMWLERLGKLPKYAPVFLFGIGSGSYLKALADNTEKEVNIVVYEPSIRIFLKTLEEVDLSTEIENRPIAFVVEELNDGEFEPVMNRVLVFENLEFFREEIHPNYKEWYAEKIIEKVRLLQRTTERMIVDANTGKKFSTHVAANIFHNVKYICEGYHTKGLMEAIPTDVPAILVSAGPSLNKNVHELKRAKNKSFIVAVDTALKPMLKAGIKPDVFITIDAKKDFHLIDAEGVAEIPVIAPTCAHYVILDHQKGKKIFYDGGDAIPNELYAINGKELPDVSSGGSVACSAFSMLYKMGFHTVIMLGQDLAYSDNKSHADGTFQEKMPEEDTKNMITVKGNYVDKIPTRRDFRIFLDWFEMYIKGAKEHEGIRVINATEGGAYIEGTEVMTLKDAIEEVCSKEVYFSEKIDHMASAFSKEERQKALDYLHGIPDDYEEIRKTAILLEKTYQKLDKLSRSGTVGRENTLKLLKRVKKLTGRCQKKASYQLIDLTMTTADYIIRSEYFYEEDSSEAEVREIARKGMMYSQLLQECAELLKKMAEEILLPMV
ncbi:MAG: motility associated factor glycosyltransferase family protein [Lachnospiraceae bacterium]|jgi:hypothetical protein|nr:motility associated factor glycosyltransferase family protein [Lachnospiraceae bacterium]